MGVPMTAVFQLVICRQSLSSLWVRSSPKIRWDFWLFAADALLIVVPMDYLYKVVVLQAPISSDLWMIASILGVFAAAYAIQNVNRVALSALLQCLGTGGAIMVGLMVFKVFWKQIPETPHNALLACRWFLLYFPVSFIIEEVTFRGLLDSYIHQEGENRNWFTACFVSALWGLWHLPTVPHQSLPVAVDLVVFQTIIGVPLSFAWRKCGNLAVPCAVHAIIDSLRNALGIFH